MNLKDAFVIVLIGGLEFSPSVDVHRILQLVFQGLDFCLLIQKVFFFETDFSLELVDASDLFFDAHELVSFVGQISSEVVELFLFVLVVNFSFGQVGVGKLYFFI